MITDTSQAQQNLAAQKDRITRLLTKQAGNQSFGQNAGDIGQSLLSALSSNTGAAGFQEAYGNVQQQRQGAQSNLYKIMQDEVAQGNEDAAHVDKAIKDITGNDVGAYEKIANEIHKSPEQATKANANLLASRAASKIGYKPLARTSDELDLSLKRAQINKFNAEATKANRAGKLGMDGVDPILARQIDKDVIVKNRQASELANSSLRSVEQIENSLFDAKGNSKVDTGKTAAALQKVGQYTPFVYSSTYQDVTSKSTKLSLDVASSLKGQTSDKDVTRSLETVPGYDKDPEANKRIIKDQKAALKVVSEMPKFTASWRNKYGSTIATDEQGRTYDEAFLDWQASRFEELGGKKESATNSEPSEEDINFTAQKHGITPDEVRRRLKK